MLVEEIGARSLIKNMVDDLKQSLHYGAGRHGAEVVARGLSKWAPTQRTKYQILCSVTEDLPRQRNISLTTLIEGYVDDVMLDQFLRIGADDTLTLIRLRRMSYRDG